MDVKKIIEELNISAAPWKERGDDAIIDRNGDTVCEWVCSTENERLVCFSPDILEVMLDFMAAENEIDIITAAKKALDILAEISGSKWDSIGAMLK